MKAAAAHRNSRSASISMATRWWIFITERFPPIEHGLMLVFLTAANVSLVSLVTEKPLAFGTFIAAWVLSLLFFFRLRLFDEVKDYETDKEVNPSRPLARGLLQVADVKLAFVLVTVLELALAASFGTMVLLSHLVVVAYSYLMYREFFIGGWLAPKLTTYAVTHTFVSGLFFLSIGAMVASSAAWELPAVVWILALVNWAMFNLFEFARKTFAPSEEREGVPSYTTVFGVPGAVLLSLSQAVLALGIPMWLGFHWATPVTELATTWWIGAALAAGTFPLVTGLWFVVKRSARAAWLFRTACSLFTLAGFGLLAAVGLGS